MGSVLDAFDRAMESLTFRPTVSPSPSGEDIEAFALVARKLLAFPIDIAGLPISKRRQLRNTFSVDDDKLPGSLASILEYLLESFETRDLPGQLESTGFLICCAFENVLSASSSEAMRAETIQLGILADNWTYLNTPKSNGRPRDTQTDKETILLTEIRQKLSEYAALRPNSTGNDKIVWLRRDFRSKKTWPSDKALYAWLKRRGVDAPGNERTSTAEK